MGEGTSWSQPPAAAVPDGAYLAGPRAAAPPGADWLADQPAVRWRELLAVCLAVALGDLVIYRGQGYAGLALLFGVGPAVLFLGKPARRPHASFFVLAAMLAVLAMRLLWLGSVIGAVTGFALLIACSVTLDGRLPHVVALLFDAVTSIFAGFRGLCIYLHAASRTGPRTSWLFWVSVVFPTVALVSFGSLFVLANPDLVDQLSRRMDRAFRELTRWLERWTDQWTEVIFWFVAAYFTVALLRPFGQWLIDIAVPPTDSVTDGGAVEDSAAKPTRPALLYWAMHNTLLAVIVLFAVYLAYEFGTLWFRKFPPGFYYSGYAHQGAAWLTVALALSTLVLSLVFRGRILDDPRLPRLRKLAWIWSAENLLLALTVYHRMYIYIDFNGMTRMRVIGLFGISTVVIGFGLVIWKINKDRNFVWFVRGQLGALALAVYLFALTPVDAMIHRYNVREILARDPAPAVQITEHPVNAEGVLMLHPLVGSADPIIREGIRALLADRAITCHLDRQSARAQHWTAWQGANATLETELERVRSDWEMYRDPAKRQRALSEFRSYAYQWY